MTRDSRIVQRLQVPFDYPVWFTRDVFGPRNSILARCMTRLGEARRHRALVCVDTGVLSAMPDLPRRIAACFKARPRAMELAGPFLPVRGGETAKNGLALVHRVLASIAERRLCRQSYVVIVGGGGVLDAVGFAASLAHRGLRVIRIPTTVVAQNDVGVGVKTGIDMLGAKNFAGTFAPPFAVINDADFLRTLPDREWISGAAEAFKVAMIKDAAFFRFLCRNAGELGQRNDRVMETVIRRCAALHLRHIHSGGDPFETGSARPLDFGHWSAHHLEILSRYALRHGEAVSIGIALDSYYAWRTGLLARPVLDDLTKAIKACGLPLFHPVMARRRAGRLAILEGLERFREHLGGELTLTLPSPLGRGVEVHAMDAAVVEDGIRFLREAAGKESAPPC